MMRSPDVWKSSRPTGESFLEISSGGIKSATPEIVDYLGFRSITNYQFVHFLDMEKNYADLENDLAEEYRAITENYKAKYFPHVSVGWDNNPRFVDFHGPVLNGSNPEGFKNMLRIAKKYARENSSPLITVNSWNEWTESSYLEPDNINGYGYLDGIKEVFPENIPK